MKVIKGNFFFILVILIVCVGTTSLSAQTSTSSSELNTISLDQFEKVGKGVCEIRDGILVSRGAYASYGKKDWENLEFSFEARTPETEEQVQIWASFREQGRNERYILGLKGGLQDDLESGRMGYMGDDAFLGIRNLDFHPQIGQWYQFKVQIVKGRVRIFLNGESKPRIDVVDLAPELLTKGNIGLGGSWIKTEYRKLKIRSLPADFLDNVPVEEYSYYLSAEEKEVKRKEERKQYAPVQVGDLMANRTEISLDGTWLFKPGYELENQEEARMISNEDKDWHLMDVPNFWNPSRIWLHGETFMEQRFPKGVSDTYFQKETDRCASYTFDYEKTKVGWYRQWVDLPKSAAGKHMELVFDAVSKVAEVYVNGQKAGAHVGMFGAFVVDVSRLMKEGKNLIAVKVLKDYVKDIEDAEGIATIAVTVEVTNQMLKDLPHGFYRDNPAGIWQPVKLIITDQVKVEDVYIKPTMTSAEIDVTVENYGDKKATVEIDVEISEKDTGIGLVSSRSLGKISLSPGEEKVVTYSLADLNPKLWSPSDPNLYDFDFKLSGKKQVLDQYRVTSGFRTFEAKGDYFYLNGERYWLRAANHTPHALGINDTDLAERTFKLYHDGNIAVTRSHTMPYSKVWMDAADQEGVGLSYEGIWPWLMIGVGEGSIPSQDLLDIWANEWLDLMKKYRNHPSLFYWTINNEMNFTHHKEDEGLLETKMKIVSDVVKKMRETDSIRPICFDSGYTRKQVATNPDSTFFQRFDDGDIDDGHNYSGWYHSSIFDNFKHTPFMDRKTPGRPLISQEWSTGYPNTETGHHTRSYLWQHQNTQTHVGNHAYPFGNPNYSLENNAFLTSELAEAIRRTHEKLAGMHHFSSITWFRNVYDAKRVEPYPTYYRMQNSLNPVLVSAELWGRHFYANDQLPTRFCIVNDQVNGKSLDASELRWAITYEDDREISSGTIQVPEVGHYKRHWISPEITLPKRFDGLRVNAKLRLWLSQNGQEIAQNEYDIVIAKQEWLSRVQMSGKTIVSVDFQNATNPVLDLLGISYLSKGDISQAIKTKADLYIISGLKSLASLEDDDIIAIKQKMSNGGKFLLLNSGERALEIFPEQLSAYLNKKEETAHMDIEESGLFEGIEFMELRYFNNNQSEKPIVYEGLFQIKDDENLRRVASGNEHHYARGDDRRKQMLTMKGFPILSIENKGQVILSEMRTDKGLYDPIPARLLQNMIMELINQ